MGGIKNKLSKLSNKVKNLLCPLSLKGADSPLGLTEGSISRWDRIAKYTSLACLSFAILSTLVLNIVSSSSSSSIESNAKQLGEVSTLANDSTCDPSNTNAASCISMSITSSSSSSSTDSNNPNLSLQIPREGGIAVGRHTVTVSTNNVTGWEMSLTGVDGNSKLVNTSNSNYSIDTLPANANTDNATILSNNTWGVALPYGNWVFIGAYDEEVNYLSKDSAVLATTRWSSLAAFSDSTSIAYDIVPTSTYNPGSRNICYGVRVDNPSELLAGDYTARVVYTATTKEVPAPILDSVNPASYELGSGADSKVTISGSNLKSAYSVYLTDSNNNEVPNGECTDIAIASDSNSLTCNMPTDQTNPDLEPGEYTIHVITQGGEATIGFTYTEKRLPDGILESTADYGASGHVAVDYDENMIPITYTGNETTPRWVIADASNTNSDTNLNWYDYPNKKWANCTWLLGVYT